jgi:DNA-binding cell septation regulator SpoVG
MDIRCMNWKPWEKGSMLGFFDLGYGGLVVKGCRLLRGNNGMFVGLPQRQDTDKDGNTQYFDIVYFSGPEKEHVRKAAIVDLQRQGCIEGPGSQQPGQSAGNSFSERRDNQYGDQGLPGVTISPDSDDIPF